MNKKIKNIVLVILWGLIYLMPLLHFLIQLNPSFSREVLSLSEVVQKYVSPKNFVYTSLMELFSSTLHLIESWNDGIVFYLSYFFFVSFAHICLDLLLFLPETCRYCFEKITNKKDGDNYVE